MDNVPIKVDNFYACVDFVALFVPKMPISKSILGGLFSVIIGCKIYVKEGRLIFDVEEHPAEFGLSKDQ